MIERAAAILRVLHAHPDGLSLAQIASRVGLARSTVHRIVLALERERFVAQSTAGGGIKLGAGLATLATVAAARDHVAAVRPYLARLSRDLQETVDLALLEHDHVLFVDQVAAPQRLRAVSAVGAAFPVHCTANGKALLASLPDATVLLLVPETSRRFTPRTITDRAELLSELRAIRASGMAVDREEHTEGICAVSRVIAAPDGWTAAVAVPLPAQRFYGSEELLAEPLRQACDDIEAALRA